MKRKMKMLTNILVLVMMSAVILFGCAPKNEPTPIPAPTSIVTGPPLGQEEEFEGRVIKVTCSYSYMGQSNFLASEGIRAYEEDRIKRLEEKYNCKIEYVDMTGEIYMALHSGEPLVDILITNEYDLWAYNLMDLQTYEDDLEMNNEEIWNVEKTEAGQVGKQTKGIFVNNVYDNFLKNDVMFFNKTMLEEAGLWSQYNLYDLQTNKQWNWDVFRTLCEKVTDEDKDIKGIYYGFTTLNDFALSNRGESNNASLIVKDKKQAPVFSVEKGSQKAALDLFVGLGKKGCVRTTTQIDEQMSPSEQDAINSFIQGKDLFLTAKGEIMDTLSMQMKDEWGVLAIPMGPESKDYTITTNLTPAYAILAGVEDPEQVVKILRELAPAPIDAADLVPVMSQYISDKFSPEAAKTYTLLTEKQRLYPQDDFTMYNVNCLIPFYLESSAVINQKSSEKTLFEEVVPKAKVLVANRAKDIGK